MALIHSQALITNNKMADKKCFDIYPQQGLQMQRKTSDSDTCSVSCATSASITSFSCSNDARKDFRLPAESPPQRTPPCLWSDVEDRLAIMLENNEDYLLKFCSVYEAGVRNQDVLEGLAYLSLSRGTVNSGCLDYSEAIHVVGSFLANEDSNSVSRFASLRLLLTMQNQVGAAWQLRESIIKDTLRFICQREFVWEYTSSHSNEVLLWELRAICLNEQRKMRHQEEKLSRRLELIRGTGDTVAGYITGGAKIIKNGLDYSADAATGGIYTTGCYVKEILDPDEQSLVDPRSGLVSLAYSGTACRATKNVRETVQRMAAGIRDTSNRSIERITQNAAEEESGLTEKLVPHPETRTALTAAGQVGLAAIGAAATVSDAVRHSSRAVASKTADVTADVVEHKYGSSAGQIVRDASETTGNLFMAMASVGVFGGKGMAKLWPKNTWKG